MPGRMAAQLGKPGSMSRSSAVNACRAKGSSCNLVICLVAAFISFNHVLAEDPAPVPRDVYCGPRCVQRVLEYFGQHEELVELVRQIQWPASSTGATLEQLQQVIQSRGIQTRAIQMPRSADFRWNHPAIFHLVLNDSPHFVVWLPPSSPGANPIIWSASYKKRITSAEFLSSR